MIRRIKRVKVRKRFTPVRVDNPTKTGDERDYKFLPPLRPHRRLLFISGAIFSGWVAFMIVMYLCTVGPHRAKWSMPSTQPTTMPNEEMTVPATIPSTMPAPFVPGSKARPAPSLK